MATDIRNKPTMGAQKQADPPSRGVCAFLAGAVGALWRLVTGTRTKSKAAMASPVIHEEVTLTPEGAEVWNQVMDPQSPVGKPTQHQRRRLVNGDATP